MTAASASTSSIVSAASTTRPTMLRMALSSAVKVKVRTSQVSTPTKAALSRPTLSHLRAWVPSPQCHTSLVSQPLPTACNSSLLSFTLASRLHQVLGQHPLPQLGPARAQVLQPVLPPTLPLVQVQPSPPTLHALLSLLVVPRITVALQVQSSLSLV